MNITISGAELNISEKNKKASSTLINNIQENQNKKVSGNFGGVIVSGALVDTDKMDKNTYASLMKETDDVKAQLMSSAATAKDNLKALFMRLSGADAVKMDENGFNLTDASPEQCINIVDRIKIELAMHSDNYVNIGNSVSIDDIKQVAGSTGFANAIADKMSQLDMPATQENIKEIKGALDKLADLSDITADAKKNIVNSNSDLTIDNIYMAKHLSGVKTAGVNSGNYGQNVFNNTDYEQLKPQIQKVISDAGLEINNQNMENAKMLLTEGVPMTSENIYKMYQLDTLQIPDLSDDKQLNSVIDKIINNMAAGESAGSTLLTDSSDVVSQVADALKVINQSDYSHVLSVTQSGETFNIKNLKNAITDILQAADTFSSNESNRNDSDINVNMQSEESQNNINTADDNYRQLQEVRIMMTAQAGTFLVKQGVNLMNTPIAELTKQLYAYDKMQFNNLVWQDANSSSVSELFKYEENQQRLMYGDQISEEQLYRTMESASDNGAASNMGGAGSVSSNMYLYQTTLDVKRAIFEISAAPDVTIGAVLKEQHDDEAVTISDFAATGNNLRQRYEKAGQTYEAVGTEVRADLGDSVKKAVKASTDTILKELGLENNKSNRDAVRILGVNSMEITQENIEKIKSVYSTLNSLIDNMDPQTVLNMIRDNVNPLNDDINKLNNYILQQNEFNNKETQDIEKYSHFLYKLEKTDGITADEREKFIGIYKMMNIFSKDAGASVGALMKQNADITMENLYSAYMSKKSYGMEAVIDDLTGIAQTKENYYANLFGKASNKITPLTLKDVNNEQAIETRTVENFCEAVEENYDSEREAEYYSDYYNEQLEHIRQMAADDSIIKELNQAEAPVTINNMQVVENVMSSGYYDNFAKRMSKAEIEFKDIANTFLESFSSGNSVDEKYEELSDSVRKSLENAIKSTDNTKEQQSYDKINNLRMANREIGYIQKLSLRHDYKVPVVVGDKIGTINLTLVQDSEDKGRVSVEFENGELGRVSCEARIQKNQADVYVISENENKAVINERMQSVSNYLKSEIEIENVNVSYGTGTNISRVTYDDAKDSVASDQLYKAAKALIKGMAGI